MALLEHDEHGIVIAGTLRLTWYEATQLARGIIRALGERDDEQGNES